MKKVNQNWNEEEEKKCWNKRMELSVRLNFFPNSKYHCFELLDNSTLFYYFRCFLKIWLILYNYLYNYIFSFPLQQQQQQQQQPTASFRKRVNSFYVVCVLMHFDSFWFNQSWNLTHSGFGSLKLSKLYRFFWILLS